MDNAIKIMALIFYAVATIAIAYSAISSWLSSRRHKKHMLQWEQNQKGLERMLMQMHGVEERTNLAVVTDIKPPNDDEPNRGA